MLPDGRGTPSIIAAIAWPGGMEAESDPEATGGHRRDRARQPWHSKLIAWVSPMGKSSLNQDF